MLNFNDFNKKKEKKIDYEIDNSIKQDNAEKISFFKLFKKYLSKKFRTFYK